MSRSRAWPMITMSSSGMPFPKMPTVVFIGCLFSHINSLVTGNSTCNIIGSNILRSVAVSAFCTNFLGESPFLVTVRLLPLSSWPALLPTLTRQQAGTASHSSAPECRPHPHPARSCLPSQAQPSVLQPPRRWKMF